MRRLTATLIVLGLLAALGYAALEVARVLAPARLRAEVEGILVRETKGPVEIGTLQLVWGLPIHLEGTALTLFGGALTIDHARARIDVLSLLTGHPHLTRLNLDGVALALSKEEDGPWLPRLGSPGPPAPVNEGALEPLRVADRLARRLLEKPFIADTLQVRDGRFSVSRVRRGKRGSVHFVGIDGLLQHAQLGGNATIELRGRWVDGDAALGRVAWKGHRERDGHMTLNVDARDLALSKLAPIFHPLVSELALRGRVDAVAELDSPEPPDQRISVTLDARELRARNGKQGEWLRVPKLKAHGRFHFEPDSLALASSKLDFGRWSLALNGSLARPVVDDAEMTGLLAISDLDLDPAALNEVVRWLSPGAQERAREPLARLQRGKLVRGELTGTAPLSQWHDADALLPALGVTAQVEDLALTLDGGNRLEGITGELGWRERTLELHRASATLDGQPLPVLDLRFKDLATLLERARPDPLRYATAQALPGITPLFAVLRPPNSERKSEPPHISLDLDWFNHRALLRPVKRMRAEIVAGDDGFTVGVRSALWAGVPIRGEVDVALRPERHLTVNLELQQADELVPLEPLSDGAAEADLAARPWTSGWIDFGPTRGGFVQRHTRARIQAIGAKVSFEGVECELEPTGSLTGSLQLDLSRPDAVPYTLEGKLTGGDLGALIVQRGFTNGEPMQGTLALAGPLAGTLVPGRTLVHDAGGKLSMQIRDGTIPKTVPPVLALALASDSLNPFSSRERIRYSRVDAELRFENGVVSSDALEIEGPDLRMFADGSIDLRDKPYPLDAEIALFLFRQLDWALVKIPIISTLLLGENQNLVAAYFQLVGTWQEPVANARPLRTLQEAAGGDILQGIPRVVEQGMKAVGALLPAGLAPAAESTPAPADSSTPAPAGS